MFWNKKKASSVVWRDKSGKVACPGDACPVDCDKSCPIWLNTMGFKMLQIGQMEGAIRAFNDALALAPDFVDVQNNIGTAYGMNNQHQEAYAAFKKALEMKPNYAKALSGLIVSSKNLGLFDEAIKYCDQLDALGYDVSDLRNGIDEAMSIDDDDYDDEDEDEAETGDRIS